MIFLLKQNTFMYCWGHASFRILAQLLVSLFSLPLSVSIFFIRINQICFLFFYLIAFFSPNNIMHLLASVFVLSLLGTSSLVVTLSSPHLVKRYCTDLYCTDCTASTSEKQCILVDPSGAFLCSSCADSINFQNI